MVKRLQIAIDKCSGSLVSVYEVKTGKKCNCICPGCGADLEAKNNKKDPSISVKRGEKIAHFRHPNPCEWAPETAIHLLAKKILMESKLLLLHEVIEDDVVIVPSVLEKFDSVAYEVYRGSSHNRVKPDLVLEKGGEEIFVEFCKTHIVDVKKQRKIENLNRTCIEINLNKIEQLVNGKLNIQGIKELLEKDVDSKKWVHHRKRHSVYLENIKLYNGDASNVIKRAIEWAKINDFDPQISEDVKRINEIVKKEFLLVPILGNSIGVNFQIEDNVRFYKLDVKCPTDKRDVKSSFVSCKKCEFHESVFEGSHVICKVKKEFYGPKAEKIYLKAIEEIKSESFAEAEKNLAIALAWGYREKYRVYYLRGVIDFKRGFYGIAEVFFDMALKIKANSPKIYYYLGLSRILQGDRYREKGINDLRIACQLGYEKACNELKSLSSS